MAQIAGLVRAAAGIVRTVEKAGEEGWRLIERSRRRHKTEGGLSASYIPVYIDLQEGKQALITFDEYERMDAGIESGRITTDVLSLSRKEIVEKGQNGYRLTVKMFHFWILKHGAASRSERVS